MAHRPELTLHHPHRDVTVLCGTRRAAVSARLIRAYLPAALLPSSALLNRRHQLDLDDWIAGSSAAVRHGLLRPSKMQRVCQELVDILADASDHHDRHYHHPAGVGAADPVPAALTDALARAQLEDRRSSTAGGGGSSSGGVRHPRTLAAFLALADISRAFGSRRIGAVLAAFFARHGARIVGSPSSPFSPPSSSSSSSSTISFSEDFDNAYHTSTSEHPHAVLLWAWSLTIARMPVAADAVIGAANDDFDFGFDFDADADAEDVVVVDRRAACLRTLLRARPDVLLSGRYDAFAAAALPAGDADEVWEGVERAAAAAMAAMERGRGRGGGPPTAPGGWWGWRGGGGDDGRGMGRRIREKERDLERHRRAALLLMDDDDDAAAGGGGGVGGGGGGMYVHEHRERRVVRRSAGLAGGGGEDGFGDDGGMSPLGLKTTYHRGHHHRQLFDPLDGDRIAWTPPRGYGVGVRIGGGGGGGGGRELRGALDSIKNDQRELRMDVHDVKDELDELTEQINKLGRRQDRGRLLRKGRVAADWHDERGHVVQDCCCGERLPEERETEWFSEWWDDTY